MNMKRQQTRRRQGFIVVRLVSGFIGAATTLTLGGLKLCISFELMRDQDEMF